MSGIAYPGPLRLEAPQAIQFTREEELKAVQTLFRRFSGRMLKDRVYILESDALAALDDAGVAYTRLYLSER